MKMLSKKEILEVNILLELRGKKENYPQWMEEAHQLLKDSLEMLINKYPLNKDIQNSILEMRWLRLYQEIKNNAEYIVYKVGSIQEQSPLDNYACKLKVVSTQQKINEILSELRPLLDDIVKEGKINQTKKADENKVKQYIAAFIKFYIKHSGNPEKKFTNRILAKYSAFSESTWSRTLNNGRIFKALVYKECNDRLKKRYSIKEISKDALVELLNIVK